LSNEHPLIQELYRQQKQGFIEEKKGKVDNGLSFTISEALPEVGVGSSCLELCFSKVTYRTPVEKSIREDGAELRMFPVTVYAPFHDVVRSIASVVGETGEAFVSEFK